VETSLRAQLGGDGAGGAAARARHAVERWQHWPLPAALSAWRSLLQEQRREAANELKASKFLELALVFKALTGFKWAVQDAAVQHAAAQHRHGALRRVVLRGWRCVATHLQDKRHKAVAAGYHSALATRRKALGVLLAYAAFRRTRTQQTLAARHHARERRKALVLAGWRSAAGYLAPIRRALHKMDTRVRGGGDSASSCTSVPVVNPHT
jgi:hypothetical protein